jgi:hypothetical protein
MNVPPGRRFAVACFRRRRHAVSHGRRTVQGDDRHRDRARAPQAAGDSRNNVIAGHVEMMMDAITIGAPKVQAGQVRALGTAASTRSKVLPDVPIVAEAGVSGYEAVIWIGIVAPRIASSSPMFADFAATNRIWADEQVSSVHPRLAHPGGTPSRARLLARHPRQCRDGAHRVLRRHRDGCRQRRAGAVHRDHRCHGVHGRRLADDTPSRQPDCATGRR